MICSPYGRQVKYYNLFLQGEYFFMPKKKHTASEKLVIIQAIERGRIGVNAAVKTFAVSKTSFSEMAA